MAQRVALVVGGAGAVGAAVARRLAAGGARVVLHYHRSVAAGEQVVADIRASGGEAVPAQADLRNEHEVARVVEMGELFFGPIDTLVACACPDRAGLSALDPRWKLLLEQFREQVHGIVNAIRASTRGMVARRRGRIVCVTSDPGGRRPVPSAGEDGVVHALAETLAVQLGPYAIAAYALAPEGGPTAPDSRRRAPIARCGEARLPTPDDVAQVVASFVEHAAPPPEVSPSARQPSPASLR